MTGFLEGVGYKKDGILEVLQKRNREDGSDQGQGAEWDMRNREGEE